MQRRATAAVFLAFFSQAAIASDLSYNFIEAGYSTGEFDEARLDAAELALGFSHALAETVSVVAQASRLESDEYGDRSESGPGRGTFEANRLSLGLEKHKALGAATDLTFGASVVYGSAQATGSLDFGAKHAEVRAGVGFGLRAMLSGRLEGAVSVGYVKLLDNDEISARASALYHLSPHFALRVGRVFVNQVDDFGGFTGGIQYQF